MSATVCVVAGTLYDPEGGGHRWVSLNWALGRARGGARPEPSRYDLEGSWRTDGDRRRGPAPAAPADAIAPESSESAGVSTRFLDPVLASPRAD